MEVHNIFKQLTTNLTFNKEAGFGATKRKLAIVELNKSQLEDKSEDSSEVSNKKAKVEETKPQKEKSLKNLEQMKIEKINQTRNLYHINVNGEDVPAPIDSIEQLKEFRGVDNAKIPEV